MKKRSLFVKFTFLISSAALVIAVTTHGALFFNFRRMRNNPEVHESFLRHAQLIVNLIDVEDTAATRRFLNGRGINVRYTFNNVEWSSSPKVPDLVTVTKHSEGKSVFWYHQHLTSIITKENVTFILQGHNPFEKFSFPWDVFLFWLCVLVAVFGFVHLKIRRWLAPVRAMQAGVKKISTGDFSIQLPETTADELGQLVRSFNKMALQIRNDIKSRDQLLRDISHELRSPLSRMLLALEFIPEGSTRQTLKNNIITLDKMTGTILEEERLDSPFGKIKREQFEMGTLINEIVENQNQKTGFIRIPGDEQIKISADRERIQMALTNVIDNAKKYSPHDGNPVEVSWNQDGSSIVIIIKDQGIGIPEENLPFIFEPFYRVDKARRHSSAGYGLGMSLTKKIIEAHGGTVSLQSTRGTGTVVTVRLPLE